MRPNLRPFHLSCPYTSLPICHCRLHLPHHSFKPPRAPPRESPLRRALLLDIVQSAHTPTPSHPPLPLLYHLHARATHARRTPTVESALAHLMRARDAEDERVYVEKKRAARVARDAVLESHADLRRIERRDGDTEAAIRVIQDRMAESDESEEDLEPAQKKRKGRRKR